MTLLPGLRGAWARVPWTPRNLPTLSLWLDADDAATLTLSDSYVTEWRDKSGNGRHVAQAAQASQPTRVANVQNGRAVVRFDGTSDALSGGDVLDLGTGGLSVAAVGTPSNNNTVIGKYRVTSDNYTWIVTRAGITTRSTAITSASGGTASSATQLWTATVDRTAGLAFWRNGTSTGTSSTNYPNSANYNSTYPLLVGASTSSTDNVSLTSFYQGDVAEIVVSLSTWSTGDRQRLEGHLAHRWGLAASLPAGHPYRTGAP